MKNSKNYFILFCLLVLMTMLPFSFCSGQKSFEKDQNDSVIYISVKNNIVGKLNIGIGWNDATVLEGRWLKHEFSEEDWDRYFGLMEWSGCHWLRHAVTITDWEPENENDDAEVTDWDKFDFNSEKMQRHYTFLDQAEKRNIKVLITNWRLGARWLTGQDDKWILAHPDSNEEFAEALAALIFHLKRIKKYQCVWALSLWNEPNGDWAYIGPKSNYPDSFWPLYTAVDKNLKRMGIRDEIKLLGPDTSTGGKPEHIAEMLKEYGPLLDIICDHDYSAFRGERMDHSIDAYSLLLNDLKEVAGKALSFVIGEFGNYGAGSQAVDEDIKVYDGALSTNAYLFRMLNAGTSGLARWEFHVYGNTWRNFGALTESDPNYVFKPYGPVFYPHAITARYVKPGWVVRETAVEETGQEGIYSTALTSADNEITVMLLNDRTEPVYVQLKLEIPLFFSILHHMSVTGPIPGCINLHKNVRPEGARIRLMLPAKSVTVLTSQPSGDLKMPEKLSLKR